MAEEEAAAEAAVVAVVAAVAAEVADSLAGAGRNSCRASYLVGLGITRSYQLLASRVSVAGA